MGKPITAFAVLQLVDKGKISLDDDIRAYFVRIYQIYNPLSLTARNRS